MRGGRVVSDVKIGKISTGFSIKSAGTLEQKSDFTKFFLFISI